MSPGQVEFALDLYARLAAADGGQQDVFLSPASLRVALAMAQAGARGETAEQMKRVLGLEAGGIEDLVVPSKSHKGAARQLSVSNTVWAQAGYGLLPDYVQRLRRDFGATPREVDFRSRPEAARKSINDWAGRETMGRIPDLMPDGTVTADTRLVLANAVYFKGRWASQFSPRDTAEGPFYVTPERTVRAALMRQSGKFRRLEGKGFQAIELPYAGGAMAMLVLLPERRDGLADFEKSLTAENLATWLNDLGRRPDGEVPVTLPRFTLARGYELEKTLPAMGMPDAFDRDRADFSGMNGGKDRLFISAVAHKAFVKVDEEGTEAAAASGVGMSVTSAPLPFTADHPFVFLIRENRTGAVMFLGRVVDPAAGAAERGG